MYLRGLVRSRICGLGSALCWPSSGAFTERLMAEWGMKAPGAPGLLNGYVDLQVVDYTVTENPIYIFPEMKLCGLVPSFYIRVSVSDLYIPGIGLPIWLQQNRQTDPGNI